MKQEHYEHWKGIETPYAPQNAMHSALVIGDTQNVSSATSLDRLLNSCMNVQFAGVSQNSGHQRVLDFSTNLRHKRSTEFFETYDIAVIELSELFHASDHFPGYWRRAKELKRIVHTMINVIKRSSSTFLMVRGSLVRISGPKIVPLLDHARTTPPDIKTSVLNAASQKRPVQSIHQIQKGITTDPDLIKIKALAKTLKRQPISLVKRIKQADMSGLQAVIPTPKTSNSIQTAMAESPLNGMPRYALHLRELFKLEQKFPLKTKLQKRRFLHWYHNEAVIKLPIYWVPQFESSQWKQHNFVQSGADQILAFLNGQAEFDELNPKLRELLKKRVTENGPSGIAILLAMLAKIQLPSITAANPWKAIEIQQWFKDIPCKLAPSLGQFNFPNLTKVEIKPDVTLIGITNDKCGLAANLNMSSMALQNLGIAHKVNNAESTCFDLHQPKSDLLIPKRSIALHHINADRVPITCMSPHLAARNDIYHIGFFLWETSIIPPIHRFGMDLMDEIWAPSNFVAQLYKNAGATNVHVVGKAIPDLDQLAQIGTHVKPNPDHFTVFTSFDFHSSVERKNPLTSILGFQAAFRKADFKQARLIIKTTPAESDHWGDPNNQISQIRRLADRDHRISLIQEWLPKDSFYKLMAQSDCILSTHRGEGFGYLPAQALAMKRPLIVTNWGGNTDFCKSDNCHLLPLNLVDVPKGHAIYDAPNAQWADVNPRDVSRALLGVFNAPKHVLELAQQGQKHIFEKYNLPRLSEIYRKRLSDIGLI